MLNQNHNEISPHTCHSGYSQKNNKQLVLTNMWLKENAFIHLLALQIGAVTMENSMEVSQKIKSRIVIWPTKSTSWYLPKENKKH